MKKKEEEKNLSGLRWLKVHYTDCRVKTPPFCETNFSFTAAPSAQMIHNRFKKQQRGQNNQTRDASVCTDQDGDRALQKAARGRFPEALLEFKM